MIAVRHRRCDGGVRVRLANVSRHLDVRQRPPAATAGTRDAEVHDQRLVVGPDHDVGGFEIAVHDAGRMSRDQARDHGLRDAHDERDREAAVALETGGEINTLHELHRDVLDAVDFAEVVDSHHVRVRDLPREQQLSLETTLDLAGGGGVGHGLGPDHLDGDRNPELGVPSVIDGAHPAGPQQTNDAIARTKIVPGCERTRASRPVSRRVAIPRQVVRTACELCGVEADARRNHCRELTARDSKVVCRRDQPVGGLS